MRHAVCGRKQFQQPAKNAFTFLQPGNLVKECLRHGECGRVFFTSDLDTMIQQLLQVCNLLFHRTGLFGNIKEELQTIFPFAIRDFFGRFVFLPVTGKTLEISLFPPAYIHRPEFQSKSTVFGKSEKVIQNQAAEIFRIEISPFPVVQHADHCIGRTA